jgi:hypothetical protein
MTLEEGDGGGGEQVVIPTFLMWVTVIKIDNPLAAVGSREVGVVIPHPF